MDSSSSSSTARCRRRVALLRQASREEVYEAPRRFCHHRLVAPRWTAWTDVNPGRRFYGCPYYNQDGGCGYFSWHDGEFGERANTVIKELLDDVDRLYDENIKIRRGDHGNGIHREIDAIHSEIQNLKRRHDVNAGELRIWQLKFKTAIALLFVSWVLFIVLVLRR